MNQETTNEIIFTTFPTRPTELKLVKVVKFALQRSSDQAMK